MPNALKLAILQGLLSVRSGGLAGSISGMVEAMVAKTNIEPHILGITDSGRVDDPTVRGGFVHTHRAYGPNGFHWAPTMVQTLERLAPDIVDTQGVWMNISRVALAQNKRRGTPFVVTPHGMLDPWALRRSPWRKRIVRWWFEDDHLARAGAIRALNIDEARAIREFGVRSNIAIVPNGISIPKAACVTDVAERAPILQFLGRFDPKKGLEPLFIAWSQVARDPSARDWQLRVNGWGAPDYVRGLHRTVAELELGNSIALEGPVFGKDKEETLRSSAGFILPSYSEGLPMAVLEAWSWGTPVLMTRACNLPEAFDKGAALEVTTEPRELARRILEYIEMSTDERRAMANAGRHLVCTKFHAHIVAYDLKRLYESLINSRKLPSDLVFNP